MRRFCHKSLPQKEDKQLILKRRDRSGSSGMQSFLIKETSAKGYVRIIYVIITSEQRADMTENMS